ncbi:MAG: hypothetical protein WBW84_13880 [Acidobacteriaceae bacterium]
MRKRSQIPSQQEFSFRFRFVKLPVVWEVLDGARWEYFRAARLRGYAAYAAKRGGKLTSDGLAKFERQFPAVPLLRGHLRELQAVDSEVLSEIADIESLRAEFFGLPENDINKLADFLDKVGAWPSSDDPAQDSPGHGFRFPVIVQPGAVWAFRDDLRDAVLDRSRKWFKASVTPVSPKPKAWIDLFSQHPVNDFHLRFELSGVVAGVVTLTNARQMLFASVLADVARGVRFRICKRKDCLKPFPIRDKRTGEYCSEKCGHLALVRRGRKKVEAAKKMTRKSLR